MRTWGAVGRGQGRPCVRCLRERLPVSACSSPGEDALGNLIRKEHESHRFTKYFLGSFDLSGVV